MYTHKSLWLSNKTTCLFKNGDKDPTKIQKLARHLRAQQQENRRNSQITHAEREKRKGKIDEGLRRISPSQHRRGCRKYAWAVHGSIEKEQREYLWGRSKKTPRHNSIQQHIGRRSIARVMEPACRFLLHTPANSMYRWPGPSLYLFILYKRENWTTLVYTSPDNVVYLLPTSNSISHKSL